MGDHALWTIGAALAALSVAYMPANAQRRVERGLAVSARASIRIYNLTGPTTVVGWDRDSVAVSGTVPAGASFFFGGSPSGVKGGVEMAEPADTSPAVFELRVPRTARVWVKSALGDITVGGVTGGLDLYTVSGQVTVRDPAEELTAESMDGPVVAAAARFTRVKTASGTIELTGGDDVGASSVTGAVTYGGDGFRRVRLESVSGDLGFHGSLEPGARLELESHAGRIVVDVPDTVSADFSVTTFQGTVRNAFGSSTLQPRADQRGRSLEFSTGSGGADVVVRSFKGAVVIEGRPTAKMR